MSNRIAAHVRRLGLVQLASVALAAFLLAFICAGPVGAQEQPESAEQQEPAQQQEPAEQPESTEPQEPAQQEEAAEQQEPAQQEEAESAQEQESADPVFNLGNNTVGPAADDVDSVYDLTTDLTPATTIPGYDPTSAVDDLVFAGTPCGLSGYYREAATAYQKIYEYKIKNCNTYRVSRAVDVNNHSDGHCHKAIGSKKVVTGTLVMPIWANVRGLKSC